MTDDATPTTPVAAEPPATARPTPPPPSNVGWAVASVIFFWPLAFSAFTNALNVTHFWLTGQVDRAQESSDRAKLLGKISLLVGLVLLFLFIALKITCLILWQHHGGGWGGHHGWDMGPGGPHHPRGDD